MMNLTSVSDYHVFERLEHSAIVLFSGVGVFGNTLLLTAYAKYSNLRSNHFIHLVAALSSTDLCISSIWFFFLGPVRILWHFGLRLTTKHCLVAASPVTCALIAGQLITASISYDRVTAFKDPFAYRSKNHKRYARRTLVFACIFSLNIMSMWLGVDLDAIPKSCTLGDLTHPAFPKVLFTQSMFICLVVVGFYLRALFLMRKAIKTEYGRSKTERDKKRLVERQIKVTRTITLIVIIYLLSWVAPNVIVVVCLLLRVPKDILTNILPIIAVGMSLNSGVNCAIYAAKNDTIRRFMKAALLGKSNNQVAPATAPALSMPKSNAP